MRVSSMVVKMDRHLVARMVALMADKTVYRLVV